MKNLKLKVLNFLDREGLLNSIEDKKYLEMYYNAKFNKKIDWNNPKTFNEKIQWLKLYDRKDIYTTMVDKYEVKEFIVDIIGKKYVIPTLGIYDKFNDIDFDKLPNQFVIKCTHDSGGIIIVKDKSKLDIKSTRKTINRYLKRNYYWSGREWPYKDVKPRIIIEEYLTNAGKDIEDYKFFTFNGKVKCFKIDYNRFTKHQANYYDSNANLLEFGEEICPPDFNKKLCIPNKLNEMMELAEKLSNNNPFVRVDFYYINNKIYFGEITFYPASGFGRFIPSEWDEKLGEWIELPKNNRRDNYNAK